MGLASFGDESFPSDARRVLWQFALHGRRERHAVGAARGVAIRNGFAILSASTTQPEPDHSSIAKPSSIWRKPANGTRTVFRCRSRDMLQTDSQRLQFSSASRFTAGSVGFLNISADFDARGLAMIPFNPIARRRGLSAKNSDEEFSSMRA